MSDSANIWKLAKSSLCLHVMCRIFAVASALTPGWRTSHLILGFTWWVAVKDREESNVGLWGFERRIWTSSFWTSESFHPFSKIQWRFGGAEGQWQLTEQFRVTRCPSVADNRPLMTGASGVSVRQKRQSGRSFISAFISASRQLRWNISMIKEEMDGAKV